MAELFASSRDSGCSLGPDALADFEKRPDIFQSICAEHSDSGDSLASSTTAQDDFSPELSVAGTFARGGLHQARGMFSGPCIDFAISTIHAARSANTFKGSADSSPHDSTKPIEMSLLG